jgi:hypothetical protein
MRGRDANDMTRARILYGTNEPLPESRRLEAGPLAAVFAGGELREITWHGVEVIRGIAFLVRDRNWGTVASAIADLDVRAEAERFALRFRAAGRTPADNQAIAWTAEIAGDATGLRFAVSARPEADLVTARAGFVILHPLEGVVGSPVIIEHGDGTIEATGFPELIDPIQPFTDIVAMTHEPLPSVRATVRMTGGTWETEDHRNWLDASFKTYFRPLALPWPYRLKGGEELRQDVALSFQTTGKGAAPMRRGAAEVHVAFGDRTGGTMPEVGLAADAADLRAALQHAETLARLGAQALAVRVASDGHDLPGHLRLAARLAAAMGARATLEVLAADAHPPEVALELVAIAARSAGFVPEAVAISPALDMKSYPPSVDRPASLPLAAYVAAARAAFPGVKVGGGVFAFFTELNRRQPPQGLLDFVQHATGAIVHAADDAAVMQTLESLPHVARSVRAFAGTCPYWLGPSHIAMPANPYGAAPVPNPGGGRLAMAEADPRAGALFGAAWAAGMLARAVQAGVARATLMAPSGPCGVVGESGPVPAFHVLRDFASAAGTASVAAASSKPREVLAVACTGHAWLANLTPELKRVRLSAVPPRLELLDEQAPDGFKPREATGAGMELPAYAVARLLLP